MPRIDPDFLCHRLNMDSRVRPVAQRKRKFNEERRLIIKTEAQKLLNAEHIREIWYPEWLVFSPVDSLRWLTPTAALALQSCMRIVPSWSINLSLAKTKDKGAP